MKEKIFKNLSLKILSVLVAIIFWVIVVNIYDPSKSITLASVPVQLINAESLTDKGYTYEVVEGSKISVNISGPMSIITDIKASDVVATADLSSITEFADYVDIDVKVVKNGQVLNTVEVTPRTSAVKLSIENRVTQQYDVGIEVNGTEAEGYVITKQSVSPSSIKITGTTATLSKVAKVKAVCDVNGAHANINNMVPVVVYDSEGNVLEDPQMDLSKSEVEYVATVERCKRVPIQYEISGEPADGYMVSAVELSVSDVLIAGKGSDLDKVSAIMIPASELNVSGLIVDKSYRKWLSQYLPNGVYAVSDNTMTVTVKITKNNTSSERVTIPADNVVLNGLAPGLRARITDDTQISFDIYKADGINISANDIQASVDLSGLSEGSYPVSVQVVLPANVQLVNPVSVNVMITDEQRETDAATQQSTTEMETTTQTPTTAVQN